MNGIEEKPIVLNIGEGHLLLLALERLVQESRDDEAQWQREEGYEGPPILADPRTGGESNALDIARHLRERAMILCSSLWTPAGDGQISITWSEAQWIHDALAGLRCYLEDEVAVCGEDPGDHLILGMREPINALTARFVALWNLYNDGWESTPLEDFEF